MPSPFNGLPPAKWAAKTEKLIEKHPLKISEIVDVVLGAWELIFKSAIGRYRIGKHIFPKPQVMGFFLHELIALEFAARHPGVWQGEQTAGDKDLVYVPNHKMSVEVKTSSHKSQVFGNRSYAQEETDPKKTKSGYYIAVNFQGFARNRTVRPQVVRIRFGWLDHADWIGQKSSTGQQARIKPTSEKAKLKMLYDRGAAIAPGEDAFEIAADEDALDEG